MKVDQEIGPLRLATHYDEADVQRALLAAMDLFRRVGWETAVRLGCAYPEDADERVMAWVVDFLRPV